MYSVGHQVGPEGDLVHVREPERAQHAATSAPVSHSANSAGKLGATMAATGAGPASSASRVFDAGLSTCLAFWLQTRDAVAAADAARRG